jgi:hypothetical protein
VAAAGEDLDHRPDRIRAIQGALRPANDLDAFDVVGGQVGEIIASSGVIYWYTVNQHHVEVRITPTRKHARDPTPAPGLRHAQTWYGPQQLEHVRYLTAFNFLPIDHRDGRRQLARRHRHLGARHHHWVEAHRFRRGNR